MRRKLFLSVSVPEIQPPIKNDTTSPQKKEEGGIKNDGDTNTSITNIEKENKKEKAKALTDEQMRELFVPWITAAAGEKWSRKAKNDVYFALLGFYEPRANKKQEPARSKASFTALSNRLRRYSGDDPAVMVDMLERASTAGWKSVYQINDAGRPYEPTPAPQRNEEWL